MERESGKEPEASEDDRAKAKGPKQKVLSTEGEEATHEFFEGVIEADLRHETRMQRGNSRKEEKTTQRNHKKTRMKEKQ